MQGSDSSQDSSTNAPLHIAVLQECHVARGGLLGKLKPNSSPMGGKHSLALFWRRWVNIGRLESIHPYSRSIWGSQVTSVWFTVGSYCAQAACWITYITWWQHFKIISLTTKCFGGDAIMSLSFHLICLIPFPWQLDMAPCIIFLYLFRPTDSWILSPVEQHLFIHLSIHHRVTFYPQPLPPYHSTPLKV